MNRKLHRRISRTLRKSRQGLTVAGLMAVGSMGMMLSLPAAAVKFDTETFRGSFDSTISFGIQKRMSSRDCTIIGNDNGGCVPTTGVLGERVNGPGNGGSSNPDFNYLQSDNGDLNYNKGDIVSAALKGTHELALKWGEGWGGFVRGTWVKDFRADRTVRTPLSDDAKDLAINNWTWLDGYVSKDFSLGGRPSKIRVGNQVISWGEDIFIYGGVNVTNAIDLRKFHTPGTQLKEVFRPAPMISLNTGITNTVSLEAYYQWRWNAFQFDPVGTYFSGADVVGKGQQPAFIPTSVLVGAGVLPAGTPVGTTGDVGTVAAAGNLAGIPAGQRFTLADLVTAGTTVPNFADRTPKNSGQYGLALRIKPEGSENEYGLYYLRYHDKIPFITFQTGPVGPLFGGSGLAYFVDYGEDRSVYGASMNTHIGDWAVGTELSYRPKDSVGVDPTVPLPPSGGNAGTGFCAFCTAGASNATYRGFVDEKKWQAHLTGIYLLGPSGTFGWLLKGLGAAEGTLLVEGAVAHYPNLDLSGRIPYLLPNYTLPDKTSYGYVFELGVVYPHVFGSGINLTPQIDFAHDVRGTSPNTIPFVEGRKAMTLSLNFEYKNTWRGQLAYTGFWGGGANNLLRDRDFLGASISYSF